MLLWGSSLLLAACQKCGFGKWTGPVSAADQCELAQLKSPAKRSIFKQVSVIPFFLFAGKLLQHVAVITLSVITLSVPGQFVHSKLIACKSFV